MKRFGLGSLLAIVAILCSCTEGPSTLVSGFEVPAEIASAVEHRALAACVPCTYVMGRNDVKKLCPGSVAPWNALVFCACSTACSAVCSTDWCARLNDVWYTDAAPPCMDCVIASCMPELLACSAAM